MKELVDILVPYLQEAKARRTKGFGNQRSWVYSEAPTSQERETLKRMIKADPWKYLNREHEETFVFWYNLSSGTVEGEWANAHLGQDQRENTIRGRLVDDPVMAWVYLYVDQWKSIPEYVVDQIIAELQLEVGQHIWLVIDSNKAILMECRESLGRLILEGQYLEYAKQINLARVGRWQSDFVHLDERANKDLYNRYWKIRLFERDTHSKLLRFLCHPTELNESALGVDWKTIRFMREYRNRITDGT